MTENWNEGKMFLSDENLQFASLLPVAGKIAAYKKGIAEKI